MASSGLSLHIAVVVLLAVAVLLLAAALSVKAKRSVAVVPSVKTAGELGPWVLIGTGLTASSFLFSIPKNIRDAFTIREATSAVGGRALSQPLSTVPTSTESPCHEFGAWVFQPLLHQFTKTILDSVGVSTIVVELKTKYTFTYAYGKKVSFGSIPEEPLPETTTYAEVASKDPVLWFAHTGIWVQSAPDAAADIMQRLDLPLFGNTVSGFGWQDMALRCIGTTPVLYRRLLSEIRVLKDNRIELKYASGDEEVVDGVVLTLTPYEMTQVKGFSEDFVNFLSSSFINVPTGVIYGAWSAQDVWWNSQGFFYGTVATTLPIGRIFVVSENELRFTFSGKEHVEYWNDMFVNKGVAAAREAITAQLSEVFGMKVPTVASAVFKAWPRGAQFWKAGADRSKARRRPFGSAVPVFWASSDISLFPGWIEGASRAGNSISKTVITYITS